MDCGNHEAFFQGMHSLHCSHECALPSRLFLNKKRHNFSPLVDEDQATAESEDEWLCGSHSVGVMSSHASMVERV